MEVNLTDNGELCVRFSCGTKLTMQFSNEGPAKLVAASLSSGLAIDDIVDYAVQSQDHAFLVSEVQMRVRAQATRLSALEQIMDSVGQPYQFKEPFLRVRFPLGRTDEEVTCSIELNQDFPALHVPIMVNKHNTTASSPDLVSALQAIVEGFNT
jgi:hypothetical protein